MVEQKFFPTYLPENPEHRTKRVSLMLTYEQVLMIASSLALLHSLILSRNPFIRWFFKPLISETELSTQTSIHNSCINCALSFEEHMKESGKLEN
jgi:hypothetical protein